MYAIIESGGKQYRIAVGQTLKLEKLPVEAGAAIELDKVLMVVDSDKVELGKPYLDSATVKAEVLTHGRKKKIKVLKFKRRKNYLRTQGHRQWFTEVKITDIKG